MKTTRIAMVVVLAALGLGAACGGTKQAYVPVDSPVKPWTPPEGLEASKAEAPAPTPAPAPKK